MPWYKFKPIPPSCDICDPNNYIPAGILPIFCSSPKTFVCVIQTIDNMGKPVITIPLCIEINNAIINRVESTNVRLDNIPCELKWM
jgi:hypothetical protein